MADQFSDFREALKAVLSGSVKYEQLNPKTRPEYDSFLRQLRQGGPAAKHIAGDDPTMQMMIGSKPGFNPKPVLPGTLPHARQQAQQGSERASDTLAGAAKWLGEVTGSVRRRADEPITDEEVIRGRKDIGKPLTQPQLQRMEGTRQKKARATALAEVGKSESARAVLGQPTAQFSEEFFHQARPQSPLAKQTMFQKALEKERQQLAYSPTAEEVELATTQYGKPYEKLSNNDRIMVQLAKYLPEFKRGFFGREKGIGVDLRRASEAAQYQLSPALQEKLKRTRVAKDMGGGSAFEAFGKGIAGMPDSPVLLDIRKRKDGSEEVYARPNDVSLGRQAANVAGGILPLAIPVGRGAKVAETALTRAAQAGGREAVKWGTVAAGQKLAQGRPEEIPSAALQAGTMGGVFGAANVAAEPIAKYLIGHKWNPAAAAAIAGAAANAGPDAGAATLEVLNDDALTPSEKLNYIGKRAAFSAGIGGVLGAKGGRDIKLAELWKKRGKLVTQRDNYTAQGYKAGESNLTAQIDAIENEIARIASPARAAGPGMGERVGRAVGAARERIGQEIADMTTPGPQRVRVGVPKEETPAPTSTPQVTPQDAPFEMPPAPPEGAAPPAAAPAAKPVTVERMVTPQGTYWRTDPRGDVQFQRPDGTMAAVQTKDPVISERLRGGSWETVETEPRDLQTETVYKIPGTQNYAGRHRGRLRIFGADESKAVDNKLGHPDVPSAELQYVDVDGVKLWKVGTKFYRVSGSGALEEVKSRETWDKAITQPVQTEPVEVVKLGADLYRPVPESSVLQKQTKTGAWVNLTPTESHKVRAQFSEAPKATPPRGTVREGATGYGVSRVSAPDADGNIADHYRVDMGGGKSQWFVAEGNSLSAVTAGDQLGELNAMQGDSVGLEQLKGMGAGRKVYWIPGTTDFVEQTPTRGLRRLTGKDLKKARKLAGFDDDGDDGDLDNEGGMMPPPEPTPPAPAAPPEAAPIAPREPVASATPLVAPQVAAPEPAAASEPTVAAAKPAPEPAAPAKEAWQMTRDEYRASRSEVTGRVPRDWRQGYEAVMQRAAREGKPVPDWARSKYAPRLWELTAGQALEPFHHGKGSGLTVPVTIEANGEPVAIGENLRNFDPAGMRSWSIDIVAFPNTKTPEAKKAQDQIRRLTGGNPDYPLRAESHNHDEAAALLGIKPKIDFHRGLIEEALAAGHPVPPEVLADYPDLAAKYAPTPEPAAQRTPEQEARFAELMDRHETAHDTMSEAEMRELQDLAPETAPAVPDTLPTADIAVNPERFQYKVIRGKTGETGSLRGVQRWNPSLAGRIDVWRDPEDGQVYVVNGHNRLMLARKMQVPSVKVEWIDAQTDGEARVAGALRNISEGRGTAVDAGKLFRDTGLTQDDLVAEGIPLQESMVTQGLALSRLHPTLFGAVTRGEFPVERAVLIGGKLPDHNAQMQLLNLIGKLEKTKNVTNDVLSELIDEVSDAPAKSTSTDSLFGMSETQQVSVAEKAELNAWLRKQMTRDRALGNIVAKTVNAERLTEVGNRLNLEATKQMSAEAATLLELFDRFKTRKGPINDVLNRATSELLEGQNVAQVRTKAYNDLREAIRTVVTGGEAANPAMAATDVGVASPSLFGAQEVTPEPGPGLFNRLYGEQTGKTAAPYGFQVIGHALGGAAVGYLSPAESDEHRRLNVMLGMIGAVSLMPMLSHPAIADRIGKVLSSGKRWKDFNQFIRESGNKFIAIKNVLPGLGGSLDEIENRILDGAKRDTRGYYDPDVEDALDMIERFREQGFSSLGEAMKFAELELIKQDRVLSAANHANLNDAMMTAGAKSDKAMRGGLLRWALENRAVAAGPDGKPVSMPAPDLTPREQIVYDEAKRILDFVVEHTGIQGRENYFPIERNYPNIVQALNDPARTKAMLEAAYSQNPQETTDYIRDNVGQFADVRLALDRAIDPLRAEWSRMVSDMYDKNPRVHYGRIDYARMFDLFPDWYMWNGKRVNLVENADNVKQVLAHAEKAIHSANRRKFWGTPEDPQDMGVLTRLIGASRNSESLAKAMYTTFTGHHEPPERPQVRRPITDEQGYEIGEEFAWNAGMEGAMALKVARDFSFVANIGLVSGLSQLIALPKLLLDPSGKAKHFLRAVSYGIPYELGRSAERTARYVAMQLPVVERLEPVIRATTKQAERLLPPLLQRMEVGKLLQRSGALQPSQSSTFQRGMGIDVTDDATASRWLQKGSAVSGWVADRAAGGKVSRAGDEMTRTVAAVQKLLYANDLIESARRDPQRHGAEAVQALQEMGIRDPQLTIREGKLTDAQAMDVMYQGGTNIATADPFDLPREFSRGSVKWLTQFQRIAWSESGDLLRAWAKADWPKRIRYLMGANILGLLTYETQRAIRGDERPESLLDFYVNMSKYAYSPFGILTRYTNQSGWVPPSAATLYRFKDDPVGQTARVGLNVTTGTGQIGAVRDPVTEKVQDSVDRLNYTLGR